ncbi:S1 RNA-binding domain-containing protein [Candidatus Woesearchaeota archaeon]|nr:S1 RNA-binding domain-containing protein [Candidatus Woesearchaeota archaeon]
MLLRREGYPEEGELVFCTVTKVQYHAVTVHLDEYDKQGLIPISEVSPGRIRNIRDFVQENKKIVCKVIKCDSERGQIDVSLRRVNESQKRTKADAIKQEQKAEKIIHSLSEKLKQPVPELYGKIAPKILEHYPWLFQAFEAVVEEKKSLESLGVEKKIAEELEAMIIDKIKPKQVHLIEKVAIKTYVEDGLALIKEGFAKAQQVDESLQASYLGGGNYRILITAKDYKKAENIISEVKNRMEKTFQKKGEISFVRQEV